MSRPIQKKWFGLASLPGSQIVVNGVRFSDNTTATSAYIVKQTGSSAYMVQDTAKAHAPEIVFMVNANGVGALLPGQCFINATPFGGSALPCAKIAQYRADIFNVANSTARETGAPVPENVSSYTWSTVPATSVGQADLITAASGAGVIMSVTLGTGGSGYFTAPAVTFTGGGTGATASTTVLNGTVTAVTLATGGTGYATGGVTIANPPSPVTATATATLTADAVTGGTVTLPGGYYSLAPAVTVGGNGTGATATATIAAGVVTGIVITAGGTGYSAATITIAAPPAGAAATATATVSV